MNVPSISFRERALPKQPTCFYSQVVFIKLNKLPVFDMSRHFRKPFYLKCKDNGTHSGNLDPKQP